MAPPVQAANRNKRKRKRKTVEFSSSSSSSSGSDDEVAPTPAPAPEPESASSTVSSDDSDSSDSDSDDAPPTLRRQAAAVTAQLQAVANDAQAPRQARASSRSPSPRPTEIPSFLPPRTADNEKEREEKDKVLKERFRKLWMSTVADEFKGDLEEIRKEPGLTQSRLAMLIDSLASVGESFPSSSRTGDALDVNEMELVVEADDLAKAAAA